MLDKLLVDAAAAAGAEMREGFTVDEILIDDGRVTGMRGHGKDGANVTENAPVVIGADGRHSLLARAVSPQQYNEKPTLLAATTRTGATCRSTADSRSTSAPDRGFAAGATNDGLTMVVGGWPYAEFGPNKKDIESNYMAMFDLAPEFAERVRGATREAPVHRRGRANFFRKPYGPGWALVGDAGYNRDPITAQGITDAFRDAELCAAALDEAFSGARPFDDAMGDYQTARDEQVAADVRVHVPARHAGAAAARDAAAARRRCTATRRRWTDSSGSTPARCRRPSSSRPTTSGASSPRPPRRPSGGRQRTACLTLVQSRGVRIASTLSMVGGLARWSSKPAARSLPDVG